MKKNELKALLTVTVITVPLVFATGCGKKAETAPVESAVQAEITETVATPTEAIEDAVKESMPEVTFAPVEETLDDSELYTENKNEDVIVEEETESTEQADTSGTNALVVDGKTYEDGIYYDADAGILYIGDSTEVLKLTKAEIESWGMTVEQYMEYFTTPSGSSQPKATYPQESEDQTVWGSGDYTGADRGHIE